MPKESGSAYGCAASVMAMMCCAWRPSTCLGSPPSGVELSTLPGEQSRVIELAYYGGFTHTQIAEMLDMPVGTVKGRMRLGLEKMRREMTGATA